MTKKFGSATTLLLFPLLALTIPYPTSASLQVYPTRLVLTPRKKSGYLGLKSTNPTPQTYRIEPIYFDFNEKGKITAIEENKEPPNTLRPFLRFSPKKVQLPPQMEQIVRVLIRYRPSMPKQDYRIHLRFKEETYPTTSPTSSLTSQPIGAKLIPKVAIAIPIIFRYGTPKLKVEIKNIQIIPQKENSLFSAHLIKKGKYFAWGKLEILLYSPSQKTFQPLRKIEGLALYNQQRKITFTLPTPYSKLKNKTIKIRFLSGKDFTPPTIFFEKELRL